MLSVIVVQGITDGGAPFFFIGVILLTIAAIGYELQQMSKRRRK